MCDPITLGLMAAATVASSLGAQKIAGAQKRDIALTGKKFDEERTKQAGFTAENETTAGKTRDIYGRENTDKAMGDAIASRQSSYTAPIQGKNFVADMPADFDPNNIIAGRNAFTGTQQKQRSISEALAKAKLDAYGDMKTRTDIGANDNSMQIGMVRRIANMSANAAAEQQGLLPIKLKADEGAGATWNAIGDALRVASMASGMSGFGGAHSSFGSFSQSIPGTTDIATKLGDFNVAQPGAVPYGGVGLPVNGVQGLGNWTGITPTNISGSLGTLHSGIAPTYIPSSGAAGLFQNAYNYVSPFGSRVGAGLPYGR